MPTIKKDSGAVAAGLQGGLTSLVDTVLEGVLEELDGPVREISTRLATAAQLGRTDLMEACQDQLILIALEHEERIRSGSAEFASGTLAIGVQMLFDGAVAGLSGLKVTP